MRRAIANSLLLITLGLFFAPMLAAELPAPIPQCCLRGGKHHCAAMLQAGGAEKTFRAANQCPVRGLQAASVSAIVYPTHSSHIELGVEALVAPVVAGFSAATICADHLRGPPVILS
jgi:hypothetical protein